MKRKDGLRCGSEVIRARVVMVAEKSSNLFPRKRVSVQVGPCALMKRMTNKQRAEQQERLFNQGKISWCQSAENMDILDKLVAQRKASINKALKMIEGLRP